ncbi:MAG TPA: N-6 DNA methylase [Clostridia bacterium]|nr:N-6 DNA methylase [Clostridia bacterium]
MGSFLWTTAQSTPDLLDSLISNRHFLEAVHALAFVQDGNVRRAVDYKNLGSEELGSVYQGLLEMHPRINADVGSFELDIAAGNERKTSGSYYTPDSLVQCLLDSALEPVIAERLAQAKTPKEKETALLSLKVCDKAAGSGHFIIRAGHRIARHLGRVRSGEEEPSPSVYRTALRDVIGHCLYGVDINPMAVELCKVTLWLEAIEPGKPLSFLDHHIRCGNSLLGTTPELISAGVPDDAFKQIEGDNQDACSSLKKLNKAQREGLRHLFIAEDTAIRERMHQTAAAIDEISDSRPEDIHRKEAAFRNAQQNYDFQKAWDLANLWCAAFVIKKQFADGASVPASLEPSMLSAQPSTVQTGLFGGTEQTPKTKAKKTKAPNRAGSETPIGITTQHLRDFVEGGSLPDRLHANAKQLAEQYQFFHFHLAFPEVFAQGGFDVSLGNPPWDALSPDQREFFGKYVVGLRSMGPEEQQAEITRLLGDSVIAAEWAAHCRKLFALVHFLKNSGVYTLYAPGNLGKGDFNIYRMFVESALRRIRIGGFAAMVVPGGLYGGANASAIRKHLFDECELRHIFGLINTTRGWFEKVDIDRFAAFAAKRGGRTTRISTQFGLSSPEDLARPVVEIEAEPIRQLAPDTYAIPDLRNISELTTSRKMYAACPTFGDRVHGSPLRHYSAELHMGGNRDLFTDDPTGLPVYEGRMIDNFDHRAKTYQSGHGNSAVWIEREFGDPAKAIVPQWRVLREKIPAKLGNRCDQFRIGFGDVANPRNQRSFAATLIPPGVICGHKVPTFVFDAANEWAYLPWLAVANSFTMDWLARCRLTAPTMSFTLLDSLPFPRPSLTDAFVQSVAPVVLRLICTAPEMTPFWNRMARLGFVEAVAEDSVPPTALVEPNARATARAELDAFIAARVFNLTAQELSDLLDTFEAFRRGDERAHKEFRTKRLILEAFANLESMQTGKAHKTKNAIPAPTWLDLPLVLPTSRRIGLTPDRYRATVLPHLLYQAGGSVPFERFRKAYWLLTEPKTLERYASGTVGEIARGWARTFRDKLEKDRFIEHLKGAVGRQLHFIHKGNERWLELRDAKVADDEHVIFDARLALLVADLWPVAEPITQLAPAEEITIQELEAVL